ncbi:hypothetical protein [Sulfuritalea sp.]|uniref:hypothetical protein n=1 Tax=Sulfuritalea sp. TaxID=2480090 RepID=UPI00286D7232|nr:hypothetical protein [Sulfuritalea sp.]
MKPNRLLQWLAVAALIFGLLTIVSGGRVLFGGAQARDEAGNIVPFVLWFNFVAGFVYVAAGAALLSAWRGGARLALFLAVSTVLVCLAFMAHVVSGGAYEMRTVGALSIRALFWIVIAALALRAAKATSVWS